VLTLMLSFVAVALVGPQQAPARSAAPTTWTGCVQAGSAPSTYRLNLDSPAARGSDTPSTPADGAAPAASGTTGTTGSGTQGTPFVQLISANRTLDLTGFVGKRVRIEGRELSEPEAAEEAARYPNRQEANETAAGTGGTPQRHDRYVRVEKIAAIAGECR
jgi:hypothetical protein